MCDSVLPLAPFSRDEYSKKCISYFSFRFGIQGQLQFQPFCVDLVLQICLVAKSLPENLNKIAQMIYDSQGEEHDRAAATMKYATLLEYGNRVNI